MITQKEKNDFDIDGFLGPFSLCSSLEMRDIRSRINDLIDTRRAVENIASAVYPRSGDGEPLETIYDAHLDNLDIYRLATNPAIVERAVELLGPDLILWRTTFWIKAPGGRRVEWHQDTYKDEGFGWFPNVNAWIAIDEASEENSVYLVEGTHKALMDINVLKNAEYIRSLDSTDDLPPPPGHPESRIARMALKPGEFVIFDGRVLHGSRPNRSAGRRAGFVARFVRTDTKLEGLRKPCILAAGTDRSDLFKLVDPPVEKDPNGAAAA